MRARAFLRFLNMLASASFSSIIICVIRLRFRCVHPSYNALCKSIWFPRNVQHVNAWQRIRYVQTLINSGVVMWSMHMLKSMWPMTLKSWRRWRQWSLAAMVYSILLAALRAPPVIIQCLTSINMRRGRRSGGETLCRSFTRYVEIVVHHILVGALIFTTVPWPWLARRARGQPRETEVKCRGRGKAHIRMRANTNADTDAP